MALFGHTHSPRVRVVDACVEVTAGAVHPEEGPDWCPTYNVIEMDVDETAESANLVVKVWRRGFRNETQLFEADAHGGMHLTRTVPVRRAVHEQTEPTLKPSGLPASSAAEPLDEERNPLSGSDGSPDAARRVALRFATLGSGNRTTALERMGLLDTVTVGPPHVLIRAVANVLVKRDRVDEFMALADELEPPRENQCH